MSTTPVKSADKLDYVASKTRSRSEDRDSAMIISMWLGVVFLISLMAGFIVLRLPGATTAGNELSVQRTIFATINTGTLTGFQQTTSLDRLGSMGKLCLVSLMVVGTLFSLIAGGLAVVRIVSMPLTNRQVVTGTLTWYILAVFAGAAILADPNHPLLTALAQAASAFGNCGIVLGALPALTDWRTLVVLMGLALLGGLSIPVLLDLAGGIFGKHRITKHTAVVCGMTALFYLIGVAACTPWQSIEPKNLQSWTTALATGSVFAIDSRSAGLPLASISSLARVTQWLLVAIMVIGAAPGSAAGGLKVTTIYALFTGAARSLRGETAGRIAGVAWVWLVIYTALAFGTFLGLLAFQPELPVDRLLFIAISAVSCVGFSQDPISMAGGGVIVLAVAMFLARVLPIALLWWTATRMRGQDVAVG